MYSKVLLIFDKFNHQKTFDIDELKRLASILSIFFFVIFGFWVSPASAESDFSNIDRINPLPTVYRLVEEKKFVEADDYLSYFMDYDYVMKTPKL